MRYTLTVRELLDAIIEQVAIKTGILLNDHEVRELLSSSDMKSFGHIFNEPPHKKLLVRPEFIEDFIRVLRAKLGNLPDASPAIIHSIDIFKEIEKTGVDTKPIFEALSIVIESGEYKVLGKEAAKKIASISKCPLTIVEKILLALAEHQDRGLDPFFILESKKWDGAVPLSKLFKGEIIPDDPEEYLDQRFLDFLSANVKDIDKIHWRNFERLCAEFFKRLGYEVELGPGSSDGGIDIRVWNDENNHSGPPLLLIQCKRYQEGKLVTIEYVKALWSDVVFENAEHGLLITTSYVATGGKKICKARKWTLSIAENKDVKKMVAGMWRHAGHKKSETKGVGKYISPPVIPLD